MVEPANMASNNISRVMSGRPRIVNGFGAEERQNLD